MVDVDVAASWISAVVGSMIVGFSGVIPLLVIPDTNKSTNKNITHEKGSRRFLSFAAGSLLGDVCLHLLPEIYTNTDNPTIGLMVIGGVLSFVVIEKLFGPEAKRIHDKSVVGYLNLFANCLDNFIHGLTVAASFLSSFRLGTVTTVAIMVHEIPHEVGDFAILLNSGFSRYDAVKAQLYTAGIGIVGALSALALNMDPESLHDSTQNVLAFSTGGFLYLCLVAIIPDLLQERVMEESLLHQLLIIFGIFVMYLLKGI